MLQVVIRRHTMMKGVWDIVNAFKGRMVQTDNAYCPPLKLMQRGSVSGQFMFNAKDFCPA